MKQKIRSFAFRIHHAIPPGIRNSYRFLIVFLRKLGHYIIQINHYRCHMEKTGETFHLTHMGNDRRLLAYWLNRICDTHEKIGQRRNIPRSNISRYLDQHEELADLTLVETAKSADHRFLPGSYLLPRWMEMEVDVNTSLKKSRMKNILRNIKKYSLEYEIRKGMDAFDLFYHQMYVPFTQKRHGSSAEISDYKHFSGKYRKEDSELFFILKDQQPVASAYIETKNQRFRVSAFGVKNADEQVFRMGVIGALYYFVMTFYQELGVGSILVGNSMPVQFDGVTEFKMQIGAVPYEQDLKGKEKFFLRPLFSNPAVFRTLKSNPLLHLIDGVLNVAVFAEDKDFETKELFLKFARRLKTAQIAKMVIHYQNSITRVREWCVEEGLDHIEFSELSGSHILNSTP